jgi:hypothetical protein
MTRRHSLLLFLCLLLAFGAAVASIADSLDGDDGSPPGGELPILLLDKDCPLPTPSEAARILANDRDARPPRGPVLAPTSLRAPPALTASRGGAPRGAEKERIVSQQTRLGLLIATSLILGAAANPLAGATFTVTNTNDSGAGSLRQAIIDVNANPGLDTIVFAIPGAGVHTITPASPLDVVVDPVLIDGYSQPGSSVNTDPFATNAVLLIALDGMAAGTGINIGSGASGSTVQGLVMNHFDTAIEVRGGSTGCTIRGNFLGTDPTGTVGIGNTTAIIIESEPGTMNTIGGTDPSDRNLVSGNPSASNIGAIALDSPSLLAGNLIGTDATGKLAIPNILGIGSGPGVTIGGSAPGSANVISGNSLDGILGEATIYGNRIGTTADGAAPLPNARYGIQTAFDACVIGGLAPGQANVIAYNGVVGVQITGINTTIRGNSIHDNGTLGIGLYPQVLPAFNDAGDADEGSNHFQNFPILQSVTNGATTHVAGKFNSTPATTFDLDFYANSACANFPREFLEGETYLGSSQVTTDGSGNAAIDVTLPVATEAGARISVTATDPLGNTSGFSQRIVFEMTSSRSGPASGGVGIAVTGTDLDAATTMTVGGVSVPVTFTDDHTLSATSPALAPGTVNDVVVTTSDGTSGTLIKAWVADFIDVPGAQQFYSFVTTLVSNGITVGVGGGNYGVDAATLRQQMAVFLLKAKHGLCYVPPPCQGVFGDVPCSSPFAPWIEAMAAEGITGGCGTGNFCPTNPVRRDQMAVFLLKGEHGSSYVPPACAGTFADVACPSTFADWIEQLAAEQITGGCGGGNYCPSSNNTRGQMAVFIVKTFKLQ